jgi:hypothetical protein
MTSPQQDSVIFKKVMGFKDATYFASSDGGVYRVLLLKPGNSAGYHTAQMFDEDGKRVTKTLHSVIAESFIGPRPAGMLINHIDGNKRNNSISNLEYVTPQQNVVHAWRTGLNRPRGSEHYRRIAQCYTKPGKLTEHQAIELIQMYRSRKVSMKAIGGQFGVSAATVCHIVNGIGKCYKEIPR